MHFLLSRRRSTQTWVALGRYQACADTHSCTQTDVDTCMQTRALQRKAQKPVITTDTHRQAAEGWAKTSDLKAIFIQNLTKEAFCQGCITDYIIGYFWVLWTSDVSHWSLLIPPHPPHPQKIPVLAILAYHWISTRYPYLHHVILT